MYPNEHANVTKYFIMILNIACRVGYLYSTYKHNYRELKNQQLLICLMRFRVLWLQNQYSQIKATVCLDTD